MWKVLIIFLAYLGIWTIYWGVVPAVKIIKLFRKYGRDDIPYGIVTATKERYPKYYKSLPPRFGAYVTYDIWEEILRSRKYERNA